MKSPLQISITFSVIFDLKPGFHSAILLVAGESFVSENQKRIIVQKIFSSDLSIAMKLS